MKGINALKVIFRTLVVILLVMVFAFLTLSTVAKYSEKKAIIFVPGLLASGLVNESTGEPVWDPFISEWNLMDFFNPDTQMTMVGEFVVDALKKGMITDIVEGNEKGIFMQLAMDEDGVPKNPDVVAADWDTWEYGQRYGALRSFQYAYEAINERYKNTGADIRVFCYDWRIDNRKNSESLEKMIEEKGYDKVVLIGHSMGNVVITNYLARSEENRNRTLAHLSYSGAILGSMNALTTLEDFAGLADMLADFVKEIPAVGAGLEGMIQELFDTQFLPLLNHLPSIAQLLPYPELLNGPYSEGDKSFIYVDGEPIKTKEDLLAFYQSRPWALNDAGTDIKCFVEDLDEYWDSFYVETENGKVHASTLVPTYYFAGVGTKTAVAVYYEDGAYVGTEDSTHGDGTVPYYSATLNNTTNLFDGEWESLDRYVVDVSVGSHFECGCEFKNETKTESFKYLDEVMKTSILDLFK